MSEEKKRKRQSEARGTPNKRSATELKTHSRTIKISHKIATPGALGPIITSLPGIAAPAETVNFKPFQKNTLVKSKKPKKAPQSIILHSSAHARLDYIAQEEQSGSAHGNIKHYAGVYDPEAGEMVLVEVQKVTLRSALRPTQEEMDALTRAGPKSSMFQQRNALGQEFGTKRAKKAIADITTNAINGRRPGEQIPAPNVVEQTMLADLKSKTEDMKTADERQKEIDSSKPRPEPDMSATQPADVYPISNLASDADLAQMQIRDWQMAAEAKKALELTMRYVARRVNKIATGSNPTRKLKLLKYMYTLFNWYSALESSRGGKRLPPRDKLQAKVDAPVTVLDSIRRDFSEGSNLTKWHIDKLILHMCAISLHIDNFETTILDLQEDLQLDPATMQKYFSELGCKISAPTKLQQEMHKMSARQASNTKIASLRIPLVFPKERRPGSGRRK